MPTTLIETIRNIYKPGIRVSLIQMEDPQSPEPGTKGTVLGVDDLGTIIVKWDNGIVLNLLLGKDECSILTS